MSARTIAERALGHPLPDGAEVHHVDGNPANNSPSNLVICQDKAYHQFLHARMRAQGFPRSPTAPLSYLLRETDADLWAQVKGYAALERLSIKDLIEQLLRDWVAAARQHHHTTP